MPNKKKLYEALKAEGYDNFADESSFNAYVDNADNRKKLFSALKQEGYDNFADETEFEKYLGYNSEDDAAFEANAERFRNGQPIERVTTQSVISANPELGLQTNAVQPEVDQTQQYIMNNKPTIFGGKKKSLMDVPLNVSTDAIEGGENLEKLSERARIAEHNMKDPFVQKARTEADVRGLASEIDGLLEKSVQEERASVGGSAFMPAGARGRAYTEANKERVKDVTDLSSAKRLLDQSQYIIDAAKRGDTGILKDTWQGFKDSLEAEDFTFGLADAASSASILDAIKKVENGEELTETEDKLLRASAINMATQYYYANDLNRAYKAGQVYAESVPFMLEMAINPISSLGKASAKTLLNYGLKSYAKQVGKGLAKGAAAGTGMALTTGLGRVAAGTTDRLAEGYNYGVDFDGNLYAEKKEDAMGVGEAVARSLASTAIENQSEMIFNAFKGFGGFMKGVQDVLPGGVNKFFDMLSHNKVADAYRYIKNSPVFRNYLVKDIRNATQIGGLGEEYLEEVYNNIANAAIGEMKWEDVVSLDKNIDTLLGLAPTQVMFGLLGLGGAGAMRYQTRKTLEDLQATMNEQQRKDLEGLLDMGLDAKEVDVRGFIRNVMQNESYTIENKRDLIKAAYNVAKQNGIDELTEADTIDKVNAENALIDSVTDPSTGIYTEITATLPDAKEGTIEVPGYVVGWLGEGEKRQPIFVQEGMENTYENRRVLKPGQWSEEAVQQMPAEEVKAISEEMIREEAAKQAEQEAKYAPEVLNAQMQQGVPFETPNAQIIPVAPMPEGNGWIVEEYALDTNNKVAKTPIVRELTNDEYRDILQAQLNAEEAAQEQIAVEEQATSPEVVEEAQPIQPTEEVRPIVEGVANQPQAVQPKQPTLEDVVATLPKTNKGEIDYKAMTPQQQYQYTSITESPEVALEDLQSDIAAGQEEIAKKQEKLSKAKGGERAALRDEVRKLTQAQAELQAFYESVAPKQEAVEETEQPVEEAVKEPTAQAEVAQPQAEATEEQVEVQPSEEVSTPEVATEQANVTPEQTEAEEQKEGEETAEPVQTEPLQMKEGESALQFAERAAEENDRRTPLRKRAEEWAESGVDVVLHESIDSIENQDALDAINSGKIVPGWYDGKAHVFLPHVQDSKDLDKTIIHEAVAHKGLRGLLTKEQFNSLCDKVWDMMSNADRVKYLNYPGVSQLKNKKKTRAAADEYMAHLAEDRELTSVERSTWEKIVQFIKELLGFKTDNKSQAAGIVNKSSLNHKDLADLILLSYQEFLQKKKDAVERLEENVGEVDAEKGDVRFAARDVLKGEERAQAIKDLMAVTGRSKRTVEKWLKAEESLASVILNEDNVGILDMEADESVPSIWKNSDYPQGTVEFSNICKKRLPFTTIYQRLQKEFPDTLFDAQTLNTIRNTMKEMGEDVACALCFVEDRRQLLGEIGQGFIDAVKGMDVELNDNQKVALDKLRESGDKYVPNLFDIITLDGMKELRKKHPAVAQAFIEYNNARGMQSGRLFQAYSAYNREILKYNKKKVESINNNGGLRIFSFSDFEAHHLIDLVQVLTDCAAKGIKVQGYTKVPEFAKAVKDTNAKINRSLIPKGVGYVDADYIPKEGEAVSPNVINGKRLLFDTIEGIDVNNPNFFDSTGSKSVGNILVAINDEHARLAMADPFVDYIIGFHTGQSKAILKGKGIDTWVNYKNEQLDKEIVTDENGNQKMKNAPHHGLNIYTDVLNVAEAEGNPIKTAKQFTERFIDECNKRGWIPRFHRFLNRAKDGRFLYTPGYHKFLIDFKLFDKNGKILPQEAVIPVFDDAFNKQILDEYVKGVKEEMPNDAVYEAVKEAVGLGEGTRFRTLEEVNQTFNEYLQKQIDGVLPQGYVYSLGNASDILRSAGIPYLPIEMASSRLSNKSNQENHPFELSEITDLPKAIQNPLAVFDSATRIGSNVILTELKQGNKNFVVAIETNRRQGKIYVNSVRSIHPRTTNNIVNWINEGLLGYANKETLKEWLDEKIKTKDYLNSSNPADVRKSLVSAANIVKDFQNPTLPEEKTSFRVVKDKNGNKSLVGLHNISEAKLKKAIKQGGLANPSMAVIDMDKQSHVDYGDITLVAPSSLVDKKTGKNIGTYTADAWTPIYPQVEKQMSKPGAKEYSKDLEQVPSELRSKVRLYFNAYLEDGNTSGALNYWFLHDTGKNPPLLTSQSNDYTNEELDAIEAISNAGYYSGLNEEEKQKVLELFIEKQGGKDVFEKNIADRIETMKKNLQRPDIKSFIKKKVEQTLQGIEEYGYDYEQVSNFYANAQRAINTRGKIDEFRTFRNAQDIVNNEGLQGEFDKWLSEKEEQFGVEEYIFVGYNNNGDRKYIPNTLENASRIMKKEGRAGATGLYGFNHFVATLAPNAGSLVQIRKKKGNLSSQEEYKEFVDKWGSVYHDLAEVLRGDYDGYSDVGYYRLEEMPTVKNPKEYVKKEYGIDLSDEFMQKYNDFVSAIKNDFPARYFETKFERPVYLNEFAAAVVPQGTSKDVVDALTEAGLPVEKYESGNNEARMAAVDKVSSEIEGIRFRVSNRNQEIFVSNAQKAVEGIKQEKATPQQWLAMIEKNGGLKAGEDKWLGLSDWLKGLDKKSVTKEEILDFINQNKIRIEEVHYEEEADMISKDEVSYSDEFQSLIDSLTEYDDEDQPYINRKLFDELKKDDIDFYNGFSIDYWGESIDIDDIESAARYLGLWGDRVNAINNTRLGLTSKGLENNREIALTIPTIAPYHMDSSWDDEVHFGDAGDGRAIAWIRFGETTAPKADLEKAAREADDALTAYQNELAEKYLGDEGSGDPTEYLDMMSEDEGKHMRELSGKMFDTRETANANQERVLVIDEIQSKRHQDGREKGYSSQYMSKIDEYNKNYELAFDEYDKYFKNTYNKKISDYDLNELEQLRSKDSELNRLYQAYRNILKEKFEFEDKAKNSFNVPDAPFEKNWHELAMKRMLRYAAENGFDKVAWTTGSQQAERYNLGNVVDSISISKSSKEDGKYHLTAWDKDTMPIGIASGNKSAEELKELFGKAVADELISGVENLEDGSDTFVLEGADLEVGGEGMKGFYDKMLPSFVNKYVKKWGTKVQDIELPYVEEAGRIMHSVDVTDAMKESVMEGQVMFRISEKGKQIQAEVDKFTSKYNSKPVRIVEAEMDDNELMEALDYAFELEDVKSFMKESKTAAGYFHNLDKIIIFADKTKVERMEEYLFHENIHAAIHHNNFANLVAHFYEYAKNEAVFEKWSKLAHNKEYKQYNSSEEFLAYVVSNAMVARNLDEVAEYLGEKQKKALNKLFNVIGYDYDIRRRSDEQSVNGRTSEETSGESSLEGNELLNTGEGRGTGEGIGKGKSGKVSAAERKARLNELFNKVADMGLQGVLGNKEYTSLMVDIYKALPEDVRAEIAEDALRLYGGSVAPAVSDYIGPKSKNSIMDKVVTIVREALRKIGFDLDLNANEVRYMAWRSKKPLDRNNMFEVAEDIDMKYRLKVGEYDGTTPDGGGTRFRRVYHGSGASFDKFDHSFMGTGEGAQAYGWGTYVTEVGGIARSYATTMASKSGVDPLSYVGEYENYVGKDVVNIAKEYIRRNSFDLKKAKEEVEHDLKLTMPALSRKGAEFLLSTTEEDWTYNPNRHLYEVEIPDDNGRNYLYWEKQYTRDELEDIASRSNGSVSVDDIDPKGVTKDGSTIKGGKIVRAMSEARGPRMPMAKEASRKLSLCGFVGIEFPAEYRTGGREDNAKNYVIFNEKDLEIKEHTRFRVANKLQVRDEYEATIKKGGYQAREAVQDAMLSLRKFQELIEKATGKKIRDFENAWMHENRLSSVVQAEIHDMERKFYKPMMDAVKKLMKVANLEQEQVADYLMLKHGIERNREMAVRKALTDDKGKIDRTRLEQWYQDKRNVRNRAATPHLDTWRKQQEELDNIALLYGADMSRDYSGLTSMFGTDDLADSTQKAYDEVEALENAHPVETESLGKAIKAMTQNTLDKSFESGLMDRKVYDELSKDMYDYYIPLRGFEETTSEEVYAYLDQDRGAFNAPLKRANGRSSKSDNPIAYLKSIAESGIMQGNRNKMKQSFLNMVINHPSDLVSVREGVWVIYNQATCEWEAASAPAIPNNATPADVEAAMEAWEQQMEQAAQNDPNIKKVSEAADIPYRVVGNRMDQHQVIVKRLGKSYTLTINGNPRLAMAINGQTNPNNTSNDGKVAAFVNNKIGAINRSLAAWYTTRNPDFVASNFMRDTFYTNTIVRAKEGNAYANKFHKNYATVLPKMLGLFRKYENGTLNPADQTEAAFIDFMMNGGETGYSNLKDLEEIKKQIAKELKGNRFAKVEALAEKLDILNRAVENTARFAAYLTSREEGRSIAKSIFDAKEISVNFNKKGAGGTFFGMTGQTWFGNLAAMIGASGRALYVFFNAAIQGSTNLMHVMKVNPKGTSAGLAAMFLMGAVVPFLFGDDDDEKDYYDLPEHVRRNHLIIPGAGDAWISIPLPIEYRIMYGMGELLTSWRTGHERGSDIARKMLSMSGQALPLNFLEEGLEAFVPSAVSPIYQVMTNSSWTGLPIYKENDFNKDDPEYTKAYSNVDRNLLKFTKALYEWSFDEENQKERIDLNPAIIETLAKGYFGGLATQLSNIAKVGGMIAGEQEFDWRNIPIGNRILKTGDERTKEKRVTNEYFENMEKLDFLQSRERMLKKTEKGVAVPEADKFKAQKDLDTMQGTEIYKKYQEFKKQKKVVDKIRKTIKEKGSTPEREKQLMEAQEAANKSVI